MTIPSNDCRTEQYDIGVLVDERYRLTEFIGAGGMACVYEAREEGSPHTYALKFLKTEYHNQEYLIEFFRDEANSMRNFSHPNIVRFYRFVNHETYSYIVMDYVDGFSLSDIIKKMYKQNREIPPDEVVRIMVQVARALDAIHREGHVHRDIKPSNILIERQTGQTFVTDLGITAATNARILGAGTLAYMPPETNETGRADHRADIYAYGIMFFEMLAKQRPFRVQKGLRGEEAEDYLAQQHREEPVPDITQYRSDLPDDLNAIMRKALAKDPDDRYNHIIDLARDIHGALIPLLSPELHDFSGISHRQITPPDQREGMFAGVRWQVLGGAAGLAIVVLMAAVLLVPSLIGGSAPATTPTTNAALSSSRTPTATVTATATHTLTPTITPTATPNPVEEQPAFTLIEGVAALANPADAETLAVPPAEDGALRYLRIGRVNGFVVTAEIANTDAVEHYGVAFRVVDDANYHLFRVAPQAGEWTIVTVTEGEETVQQSGDLAATVTTISVTGRDDFFQIEAGDAMLSFVSDVHPQGSLALWVESASDAPLQLASLQVGLIGDEARAAADITPTPAPGIADPRRFLRADVNALLATNDILNSAIECPAYIDVYNTLNRHLDSRSATVRRLAGEVIDAGEIIYSRCRSESPDDALSFVDAIQDYLDWERDLREILDELRSDETAFYAD